MLQPGGESGQAQRGKEKGLLYLKNYIKENNNNDLKIYNKKGIANRVICKTCNTCLFEHTI